MTSARPSPRHPPANSLWRSAPWKLLRGVSIATLVGMVLLACPGAQAANLTWNGGGKKNNWADKNNWGGTAINGNDTLIFAGTTQLTNVNDIDSTTASGTNVAITFNNTAGAFTISGSAMSFTGASVLTNQDANTQTISLDGFVLAGTGTQTIAATSGELLINSVISGTTPLSFTGIRTTLTGANTYTGLTTITSGTVNIQDASALGGTTNGTVVRAGGALELQGGITVTGEALTLSGSGGSNAGALRNVSGTNTYAGIITLGTNSRINSDSGLLTLNTGTITGSGFSLIVGGSGNTTISSVIGTGTGSLTKDGTGTLRLSATNTYSGLTTVSGGTLALGTNGAISSGGVTVNGGNLDISSFSDTVGAVTVTSGTILGTSGVLTGSSYTFDGNGAATAVLGGSGGLTKSGTGTGSTLSGANTYTGTTTIASGTLSAGSIVVSAGASNLGNASSAVVLGDGTNQGTLAYTGSTATYTRGFTVNAGGGQLVTSTAGQTLTVATGNVTSSTGTFTVGGAGNTIISSTLSLGTGGLTMQGAGTLTLQAANTFSGLTTVAGGTLAYGLNDALGSGGLTVNGGNLDISSFSDTVGAVTVTSGTIFGTTGVLSGSGFTFNGDGDAAAILGGSGTLTKSGAGTTSILSGANTYSGATSISSGILNIQNNLALGGTAAGTTVSSGAALELQGGITVTGEALTVSGSGVSSGGALRNISGNNTYAGVVTLGTNSRINSDSGLLTLNTGTITNATGSGFGLIVGGSGTTTISSIIGTGTGSFTKDGSGTVTLSGVNTYTGTTGITSGVLNIQNGSALGGTGAGTTVAANAALELQGGITVGAEALSLSGSGVSNAGALRNISGNNAYGGVIALGTNSRINSDSGQLTLSGTIGGAFGLTFGGSGNIVVSNTIGTGAGTLTKDGTGTLTLSAANTYTGATTVLAGVLNVQNATALGTTANGVTVAANAALELQGGITVGAEALSLSGSGVGNAGGLRNISGNNTYGGLITLGTNSRINSDAGLLSITNAGTITGAGFSLTVGGAGDTSIAGIIGTTTGGLTKDGAGKLTLSTTSSYTGVTTINGGILSTGTLANGGTGSGIGASGTAAANLVIDGGTLQYTGTTVSINRMFTTGTSGATLDASGSGALTLSNTSAVGLTGTNASRTLTLTGTSTNANTLAAQITDNGTGATSLLKNGTGTWVLSGTANSYTGSTTISNGSLQLSSTSANSLPTSAIITLGGTASQGKLILGSAAGAASQTVASLSTTGSGGSVVGGASTASTLTINVATGSSNTFGGVLGGAGSNENNLALTKTGAGLLTLTGSSTYTGVTTLSGGTVSISSAANLGSSSAGITFATTASTLNVSNDVTLSKAITQNAASTYDVDAGRTLTLSGTITGGSQLFKTGAGTVVLNAANGYTGKTNILGGTLKLGVDNAIAGPNIDIIGGTFDLNGRNEAFSSASPTFTLGNSGTAGNVIGTGTVTVQSGGGGYAVRSGSVGTSAVLSGSAGLTKTTAQTVTLSGNNTYTGATAVENGILQFATTASGSVAQSLGTNNTVNLGVAATSSGVLQYTGAAGTLSKSIYALGNGSDTIQNAGTGLLTLSGSLVKNGTVLNLKGGSNGINVTGVISGTSTNSDLYVTNGLTTLSATSSYNGPTYIVDSGTLALGINNAVPAGSIVTIGGTGGAGRFSMGSYTNAIGGLVFSGSGGTLAMNASQTSTAQLASSGAVTLGANSSLDLAGTSASSGLYRLIAGSSVSGTFNSFSGLSGYSLLYTATSVNAQQQAVMSTISATTAATSIITGGSTAITYSLTNNALSGGASLNYSTSNVTNVSGSSSGTLAAGATANNVSGLSFTGSTVGAGQTGTFNVNDPAASNSPQTGSVTVDVYGHAQNTLSTGTIGLGNVRVGYASPLTGTIGAGNAAGYRVAMSGSATPSSSGNVSLSTLSGGSAVAAGATGTITATLGTGNTAGGVNQNFTYTFADSSSLSGASSNVGTAAISVTGGVYDYANATYAGGTLAFGNVRTGASVSNQTIAIGNQTITNSAYQDSLNVSGSASNSAVTATGFTGLAASTSGTTTNNLSVGVSTATAGNLASTVNLTLISNANGVAGLSNGTATVDGTPGAVTTTGGVYDYANAKYAGGTLAFGNIHQGASASDKTVQFGNQTVTDASYQDTLNVSATTGNALVSATGFTGLTASTNGLTTDSLTVSVNTATAGSLASTLSLSLVSNANGVIGLSNGTATVVGTPGAITTTGMVYSGQATWATNGGGNWGTLSGTGANAFGSNWGANQGSPGLDPSYTNTDTATFGSALTSGSASINTAGANISLKALTFDNANASYGLYQTGGSGAITLVGSGTETSLISVAAGSHTIHADVTLGSSMTVDVAANSQFTFHNVISGSAGYSLTKTGAGTASFVGNNDYTGNTDIMAGTVSLISGATPLGLGTVTVYSGATLDFNHLTLSNTLNVMSGGILMNTGSATTVDVTSGQTVVFEGATSGTVDVQSGGTAEFSGVISETSTVTVTSGGTATMSGDVAGTVTVAGDATVSGLLTGNLGVSSGGSVTFDGSNTTGSSFNVASGGTVTTSTTSVIAGQLHVSGSATIAGTVTSAGDVAVQSGGTVTMTSSAVLNQSAITNNGTLVVDRSAGQSWTVAVSGTAPSTVTKQGDGSLTLTGAAATTDINVQGGAVVVDGNFAGANVTLAALTAIGGSGTVGGLSGSGSINPGNSPGIFTSPSVDPTGGMSFNFEFTTVNSYPVWSDATNSLNDVLHLTSGTPFTSDLTSANVVNIYFDTSVLNGGTFYGAFFASTDILSSIQNGTFNYFEVGAVPGQPVYTYNGVDYHKLDSSIITLGTTQVASANFVDGTVTNGFTASFVVVPEPSTAALAVVGLGSAALFLRRRRRPA